MKKNVAIKLAATVTRGPLGKDGDPFAPCSIMASNGLFSVPINYSVEALLDILLSGKDFEVIDRNNRAVSFTKSVSIKGERNAKAV